jgi:large subunit ribosomal protein L18
MKVKDRRIHRKIRIRKKIAGTSTVPRLAVFKSNNNIYVQAIDDLNHVTLASASTL